MLKRQSISRTGFAAGALMNFASAWAFYLATVVVHGSAVAGRGEGVIFAFARYALGFGLFAILYAGRFRAPDRASVKFIALRAVFNVAAVYCFYRSVELGDPARANILNMTYPLFVAIVAGPLLKERLSLDVWALVGVSVCGILMTLYEPGEDLFSLQAANLWGLASAALAGVSVASLRGAALASDTTEILFWMFGIGVLALSPALAPALQTAPALDWVALGAASALGVAGQWLLTVSYRSLDAAAGSVISTTRIPIALIMGWLWLGAPIQLMTALGAALITACNVLLAIKAKRGNSGAAPGQTSERL